MDVRFRNGYWSGMPIDLKGRAVGWGIYYLIALGMFTQSALLGGALLLAPSFWYVAKNLITSEFAGRLDLDRRDTLSGYTLHYLWNASVVVRIVLTVLGLGLVLFGLGWISTEDLRLEAAKPTITERVTGAAGSALVATKETSGGWVETAKSWFDRGEGDDADQ